MGVLLHRCSKLNNSKGVISSTVGSLTRLRDKGSSSESLSLGSRKSPLRCAVLVSWSCVQRWSKGSAAELVLRLVKSSNNEDLVTCSLGFVS